jgi:hypothetical protein
MKAKVKAGHRDHFAPLPGIEESRAIIERGSDRFFEINVPASPNGFRSEWCVQMRRSCDGYSVERRLVKQLRSVEEDLRSGRELLGSFTLNRVGIR